MASMFIPKWLCCTESMLEVHYNELLKMIEEIGRDVKPSYTSNKVSTDRLKKSMLALINVIHVVCCSMCMWSTFTADIMMARGVLRDCMADLDKLVNWNQNILHMHNLQIIYYYCMHHVPVQCEGLYISPFQIFGKSSA